jgi:hypothetical protein
LCLYSGRRHARRLDHYLARRRGDPRLRGLPELSFIGFKLCLRIGRRKSRVGLQSPKLSPCGVNGGIATVGIGLRSLRHRKRGCNRTCQNKPGRQSEKLHSLSPSVEERSHTRIKSRILLSVQSLMGGPRMAREQLLFGRSLRHREHGRPLNVRYHPGSSGKDDMPEGPGRATTGLPYGSKRRSYSTTSSA